jgi:hypothetical protein
VTQRELTQRSRVLSTMLTVLDFRYAPGPEPAVLGALRQWFSGWPGIGRIVAGMSRQGFDLQLVRHGAAGRQATFYTAGQTAHSQASAVGSAWAPEP